MKEIMPKVVFIDLLKDFYDQHGIYSLSSSMKRHNISAYFISGKSYKRILARIAQIKPDLLLYSTFFSNIPNYIEFDRIAKRMFNVKSLIGGPGPTFNWECIKDSSIDAACIGEGESALVDFINGGFRSNKNIFCRDDRMPSEFYPLVELDNIPFPDRDIIYQTDPLLRDMPSKQFLSGRGCPYECTYCFNHNFRDIFKNCGPIIRKKSVDYLLEEIRLIKKKYPLANVVFNDDIFIVDKKWFLEFCGRFPKEIGLTYTCNIRANLVDEQIVKALRKSNCIGVNWSIESGNDFLRNKVLKRGMSSEQILNTAYLLTKYKIPYRTGNIIGLPGENYKQMLETLELNIKAKPNLGLANIFIPFPMLKLTEYAIKQGYYKPDPRTKLPKDFFTRSPMNINPLEHKTIQKLMCLFPIFVKFPFLFYNPCLRKALFWFPLYLLRKLYEAFYCFKMMKLYVVKAPFLHRCRMAIRYAIYD